MPKQAIGVISIVFTIVSLACDLNSQASESSSGKQELLASHDEYLIHAIRFLEQQTGGGEQSIIPEFEVLLITKTSRINGQMKVLLTTGVRTFPSVRRMYVYTRLIGLAIHGDRMVAVLFTSNRLTNPPSRRSQLSLKSGSFKAVIIPLAEGMQWEHRFRGTTELLSKPVPEEAVGLGVITRIENGVEVFGKRFEFNTPGQKGKTEGRDIESDPLALHAMIEDLKQQLLEEQESRSRFDRESKSSIERVRVLQKSLSKARNGKRTSEVKAQKLTEQLNKLGTDVWIFASPVLLTSIDIEPIKILLLSVPYDVIDPLLQEWDRKDRLWYYLLRLKRLGFVPEIRERLFEYSLDEIVEVAQASYWPIKLPLMHKGQNSVELCSSIEDRIANDVLVLMGKDSLFGITSITKRLYCFEAPEEEYAKAFVMNLGRFLYIRQRGTVSARKLNTRQYTAKPEGMVLPQLEISNLNMLHWSYNGYGTPKWAADFILPEFAEHFPPTASNIEGERLPRIINAQTGDK